MISIADPSNFNSEAIKNIQQQLVLLLHAHKCVKKDGENRVDEAAGRVPRHQSCNLPHCSNFKQMINHMRGCTLGLSCQTQNCSPSQRILRHWQMCTNKSCTVCEIIHRHKK